LKKLYFLLSVVVAVVIFFVYIGVGEKDNHVTSEETEPVESVKETVDVISNTDLLNKMPDYEREGKDCQELDDNIKRGDCFQKVNSSYLMWTLNEEKNEFYFPYQYEQDHWEDVFYYNIDENDQLGELQKTDYFEEYEEDTARVPLGEKVLEAYWYVFSSIIPKEGRPTLKRIYWTDTGDDFVFGVGREKENVQDSLLMISDNIERYYTEEKAILIHEYGHVLTLNEEQVPFDDILSTEYDENGEDSEAVEEAKSKCSTFYSNYGCMNEDSYLYHYYEAFWADKMDDFDEIDWEAKDDYKDFFFTYENEFFNSYQGTNPHEDIAESFSFFVMLNSEEIERNDDVKYQKLDFFYDYNELIDLRAAILENIYLLSVKDGEFY